MVIIWYLEWLKILNVREMTCVIRLNYSLIKSESDVILHVVSNTEFGVFQSLFDDKC